MEQKLDTQLRGHHPDSPSSLQSSEACAHFTNLQRESRASEEGTLQHKAAETRNLDLLDSEEQQTAVKRCIALEDAKTAWLLGITKQPADILREVYLAVCPDEFRVDDKGVKWPGITGGFPDFVAVSGNLGLILDWKFGKIPVTPTRSNLQGISYALALFQKFVHVDEILVQFYHPYLEVTEEGEVKYDPDYEHVFKRSDMQEMEYHIRATTARKAIARAEGLHSKTVLPRPCANLCVWCANKAECPPLAAIAAKVSEKYLPLVIPDEVKAAQLKKPEDYAAAYRLANQIETWAKEVKRRCNDAALTEDIEIPGFQLVRRSERQIQSVSLIRDYAIRAGLTLEEFESCVSLPITKVEELIAEKVKAKGGKAAPKIREFQENITEAGAVTLAPGYTYLKEVKTKVPVIEV